MLLTELRVSVAPLQALIRQEIRPGSAAKLPPEALEAVRGVHRLRCRTNQHTDESRELGLHFSVERKFPKFFCDFLSGAPEHNATPLQYVRLAS